MEFLKAHWYWVVGAVIGLWLALKLFKAAGSSTSAGANVSTPTGTQIVYGGTNANDAAVQVAQMQAQSQLAAQQIAAGQSVDVAKIALAATQVNDSTDLQKTQVLAANALAITNSNNNTAVIQSNNQTEVQLRTADFGYQLGVNTNATNLAALENTNAAKLASYGIQAQVVNNQIDAARDVSIAQIGAEASVANTLTAAQLQAQQMQATTQQKQLDTVAGLIYSGKLNKGGAGGQNQIAVLNSVINPATAGSNTAAVASSQASQAASSAAATAAMWNGIATAVKGGLTAVFA